MPNGYSATGFNNPALGQSLGSIASMFAPPTAQEQLVAQTLQGQQAQAARLAAARAQLSPRLQQLSDLYGGDPVKMAAGEQLALADQGAPIGAQGSWGYARDGQFGNTPQAKVMTPLSAGQSITVPAGVAGPLGLPKPDTAGLPTTISNEAPDADPTVDNVIAKAVMAYNANPSADNLTALKTAEGARAAAGGTNVTIDNKAQTAEEEGYGKGVGGILGGVVDRAAAAPQTLAQVATLRDALNRGGSNIATGPFAQYVLKGKQAIGSLLGTTLDGVPESEVVNNIGQQLAAQGARTITNRPTQFEFAQQLATKPGLAQSPQGMMALLNIKEQQAHDDMALGQLAADPANRKNWLAVQQQYYANNPVMSPFRPGQPFGQADIDAIPTPGGAPPAASAGGGGAPAAPAAPAAAAPGEVAPVTPFSANGGTAQAPIPNIPVPPSVGAPAAATAGPPVLPSAQAAQAPPGTVFRGRDGNLYRVPAPPDPQVVPALTRAISPAAVAHLQANPGTASDFDAYYGSGAAASVLGQ